MGIINWACLVAAYGVALVVEGGNPAAGAGFLLPFALVPAFFVLRARPARRAYHGWTLALTILAAAGEYYGRTHVR